MLPFYKTGHPSKEGTKHTCIITRDMEMPEKTGEGMRVEVSGADIVAVKIEALSEQYLRST